MVVLDMGGVAAAGDGDALFKLAVFCKSPLGPKSPDCIKLARRSLAAGGTALVMGAGAGAIVATAAIEGGSGGARPFAIGALIGTGGPGGPGGPGGIDMGGPDMGGPDMGGPDIGRLPGNIGMDVGIGAIIP